jgi:phage baseplate assembly protein W
MNLNDIFHEWGSDLVVGVGGDLAWASSADAISQRVIRRLLTNPGDYIWNLDYGGGLAQFVGAPANPAKVEAIVNTQLALESAVPQSPAPQIKVAMVNAADGYVVAKITYGDPSSGLPVGINITAGGLA